MVIAGAGDDSEVSATFEKAYQPLTGLFVDFMPRTC